MPVTHSSKLNSSLWEVPGCPYELVTHVPGMTLNATGFLKVCKWLGILFAHCLSPGAKAPAFTVIANCGSLHSVVQAPRMPPSTMCLCARFRAHASQ